MSMRVYMARVMCVSVCMYTFMACMWVLHYRIYVCVCMCACVDVDCMRLYSKIYACVKVYVCVYIIVYVSY